MARHEQWPDAFSDTTYFWQLCHKCCSWHLETGCEHWQCAALDWNYLRKFSSSNCRAWAAYSATSAADGSRTRCCWCCCCCCCPGPRSPLPPWSWSSPPPGCCRSWQVILVKRKYFKDFSYKYLFGVKRWILLQTIKYLSKGNCNMLSKSRQRIYWRRKNSSIVKNVWFRFGNNVNTFYVLLNCQMEIKSTPAHMFLKYWWSIARAIGF